MLQLHTVPCDDADRLRESLQSPPLNIANHITLHLYTEAKITTRWKLQFPLFFFFSLFFEAHNKLKRDEVKNSGAH